MADFFREVDEEVRRDKALETFTRYQHYLLAAALAIVVATAGYRYYESTQIQAAEAAGAKFEAAVELARSGKSAEAQPALEDIAKSAPDGYRALALMADAGAIGARDAKAGADAFDALARNANLPQPLRDVARLRAALLRLDEADLAEMTSRLAPLTADTSPFRHSAREYLALAALKANDLTAAGDWLDRIIVDPKTPEGLRARADELSGLVAAGLPAAGAK